MTTAAGYADVPITISAALVFLSDPTFQLYTNLAREAALDPACARLWEQLAWGELGAPWRKHASMLLHGSCVFMPLSSAFLPQVLQLAHTAHEGIQKTLHCLHANFYVEHDRAIMCDYVRACTTCQRNKTESLHPACLLQPLEVPSQVWADIAWTS
ncbi:hypothetical protein U9M48_012081 [Paspalum notatum var. saurae]|uniref:Integrase zinc-binding domain-containing protein n=1 Tax=Paspalum notatum var. saurae TaxID=547442 RepID=A0AAQ3SZ91_PASNO